MTQVEMPVFVPLRGLSLSLRVASQPRGPSRYPMAQQSGSVLGRRNAVCGDWIGVRNEVVFCLGDLGDATLRCLHHGCGGERTIGDPGQGKVGEKRWKEQGTVHRGGGGQGGLFAAHHFTRPPPRNFVPQTPSPLINPNWGVDEMPPRRPVELHCRDAMPAASLPHGGGAHGTVAKS